MCSPGIRDPSQYFRDPPPHVLIDSKNSARRRLNACRQDFYNAGANFFELISSNARQMAVTLHIPNWGWTPIFESHFVK